MRLIRYLILGALAAAAACNAQPRPPHKEIPPHLLKFPARSFASPVGQTDFVTEPRDWLDSWYNARDFGEDRHLGEDWNKNTGGDTDCGEAVYAVADGNITFAADAGTGWGNVVIVEHTAPDGTRLQSLYGHLETMTKTGGAVKRREQIGTIGNAKGRYTCHLHLEIRAPDCPHWNQPGAGYGERTAGWVDPSEFIERIRRARD